MKTFVSKMEFTFREKEDHETLDSMAVEDAMVTEIFSLDASKKLNECVKDLSSFDPKVSGYPIKRNNSLVGIISKSELMAAYKSSEQDSETTVYDIGWKKIIKIYPDQSLLLALHLMDKYHVSRLPVVSRLNDRQLIGIVTPDDIVKKFGFHVLENKEQVIQ